MDSECSQYRGLGFFTLHSNIWLPIMRVLHVFATANKDENFLLTKFFMPFISDYLAQTVFP